MIHLRRLFRRRLFPRDVRRLLPGPRVGRQFGLFAVARRRERVRLRQRTHRPLRRLRRPTLSPSVAARIHTIRRWKVLHFPFGPAFGRRIRLLRSRAFNARALRAFGAALDVVAPAHDTDAADNALPLRGVRIHRFSTLQ